MDKVYDEIHQDSDLCTTPKFPDECPVCGELKTEEKTGWLGHCKYGCGGGYDVKPQIQNHTTKWWGHCGRPIDARKEAR